MPIVAPYVLEKLGGDTQQNNVAKFVTMCLELRGIFGANSRKHMSTDREQLHVSS